MAYCLDASAFIEAKDRYYALDFCPAFWGWIDREKEAGNILCVKSIYDEITRPNDELATWIKERRQHNWLCAIDTESVQQAGRTVVAHVEGKRGNPYSDAGVARFMAGADPWLIAYCLANGHTLVTHEVPAPQSKQVKIPDVCNALNVRWVNTFDALRQLRAQFVLEAAD